MKSLIISPHSFVDLITNSSSELFICDTKKSIDTVKEIVIELVKITNQKMKLKEEKEYDISTVFTDMFQEPEICQFDFPDLPEKEELEDIDAFNNNVHPIHRECLDEMYIWERSNPVPRYPGYDTPSESDEMKEYNKLAKIYKPIKSKKEAEIFKPYFDLYVDIYKKCLKAYCVLNNIDFYDIEFEDVQVSSYPHVHVKPGKYSKFITEFDNVKSWGYTTKKGNIILNSVNDNSIPYSMWEDLKDILKAQRIHLG